MPAISEMEFGYSTTGLDDYIAQIRAVVLEQAAEEVKDLESIRTVCNQEWEGKSKEKFLENFQTSANHVSDQLHSLYSILTVELESIRAAMSLRDENAFTEE